ncbi:hypothetical protein AWN76_014680 [Rhodothermaceae bacterium RA]|nr:hypothetical protein AWN76_014680 [Rhodothermaceae bacterium RA]
MPEYLAPGVYVEETSFRPKTIEGVSTSTAGFVGPTRYGPVEGEPELLTSFADFERLYGGLDELVFGGSRQTNFLAQGVRAFFEEGGKRCYVARVYAPDADASPPGEGRAWADNQGLASPPPILLTLTARFPGVMGNLRVTIRPRLSPSVLVTSAGGTGTQFQGLKEGDVVYVRDTASPPQHEGYYNVVLHGDTPVLRPADGAADGSDDVRAGDLSSTHHVARLTVDVEIQRPIYRPRRPRERFDDATLVEDLPLNPADPGSLAGYFTETPSSRVDYVSVPFFVTLTLSPPATATGADYAAALFGNDPADTGSPTVPAVFQLTGGSDGRRPGLSEYTGTLHPTTNLKSGFLALEDLDDVSIVAAPGYSYAYDRLAPDEQAEVEAIQAQLIAHCERMKYRIAVLDAPDQQSVSAIRAYRGRIDSKWAALYYPWVTIFDPVTEQELNLPPSGFVSGIYARNDVERGVQKAPANEVVRLAVGFEYLINKGQQDVLNPEGINCFRFFEGRGHRLWGARTATSDGEWKYVNLRRYFAYLERSIDKGTQVFVFESNGERLWDNVRRTIADFLFNEWKSGRLMGLSPEEAFFVRCDRSTMTQNDIDNGRLICLIGVAPLRPAEFVIFRIGQKLLETRG